MTTLASIKPVADDGQPSAASALVTFVTCAQLMLDPATPEAVRRQAETRLLARLPVARALGVFDLFEVRDPAMAALLRDEMAMLDHTDARTEGRCHGGTE